MARWPVFRIKFDPSNPLTPGQGQCTIRLLESEEMERSVLEGKAPGGRVGLLKSSWVEGLRRRRREADRSVRLDARQGRY